MWFGWLVGLSVMAMGWGLLRSDDALECRQAWAVLGIGVVVMAMNRLIMFV